MAERIELPQTPSGKPEEQLRIVYSYLYQLAESLNRNLEEIGGGALSDSEMMAMKAILTDGAEDEDAVRMAMNEAETLKSLIIKTATWVQSKLDMYRMKLLGDYVADGTFGKYVRHTGLDVDITPTGLTQNYTFEEVIQGLRTYEINAKNYIKCGLLYTDQTTHLPVYGIDVGKDIVTFQRDGTEIYNDSNKVARFTADELSFWQNGSKAASYKADRIDFFCGGDNMVSITPEKIALLYDGVDLLYSMQDKLYAAGDVEIEEGNKLIVDSADDIEMGGEPVSTYVSDAVGTCIAKTTAYQTADAIVAEAEWQSATAAGLRYIAKTTTYQTADAIMTAAQTYVDGQLTDYSTSTQTASMISQAVGDCYGRVSGITIESAGIDISGSQYVHIASGGSIWIRRPGNSTNAVVIDNNGIGIYTGAAVVVDGGSVAIRSSGTNAVYMDSTGIGIYSGADIYIHSGGDFIVESGGDVFIESGGTFTIKNTAGTGNAIYMDRYGIGIYSGAEIEINGGSVAIKSGSSNAIYMDNAGIGVYSGADIEIMNGGDFIVRSGGDVLIESGGTFTVRNYAGTGNAVYMDRNGIGVYSGAAIEVNGGSVAIKSGSSNAIYMDNAGIGVYSGADIEIMNGGDFIVRSGGDVLIESGGTFTVRNYVGTGNAVYMDRNGIGVYSGAAIEVNGGSVAIKSSGTNAVYMDNTGIGIYSGASVTIHNNGDFIVESGGDVLIESGGTFTIRNYAGTGNAIYMDRYGIGIYSGAEIEVIGGSVTIQSGSTFDLVSSNMTINSTYGYMTCGMWTLNQNGIQFRETDTNNHVQRFQISTYNSPTLTLFRFQDENETAENGELGIVFEHDISNKTIKIYRMANRGYIELHVYELHANIIDGGAITYDTLTQRSSRDVKKDIKPIEPAGDRLDRLTPVSFIYKDDPDEKIHQGLIYEDTVEIMPEICTNEERDGIKAISYVEMIPILLKEIQELRARVKALEEQNAEV